jgi:hypothetical protein
MGSGAARRGVTAYVFILHDGRPFLLAFCDFHCELLAFSG